MVTKDEGGGDGSGASSGEARRCPNHPEVKTSTDDGTRELLCPACEAALDAEFEEQCRVNAGKGGFDGEPTWLWPYPNLVRDEDAHVKAQQEVINAENFVFTDEFPGDRD